MIHIASILTLAFLATAQEPETVSTTPLELDYAYLLEDVYNLRRLTWMPRPGERGYQFSSYDRRSHAGAEDSEAWFANHDRGQFLREENFQDETLYVMADAQGPGVITRIWSANPSGDLLFFVDGATEPVWRVPFADLLSGKVAPFLEPMTGMRARGWNCYAPFPFQESMKIACTAKDVYYHVNVRQFADGTVVPSMSLELFEQNSTYIRAALRVLSELLVMPKVQRATMRAGKLVPGSRGMKIDATGSGTYRIIRFKFQNPDKIEDWDLMMRALRIRIDADRTGKPQIDLPIGDFFGVSPGFPAHRTYVSGTDPERGLLSFHLPIPFEKGISLAFHNDGAPACVVRVDFGVDRDIAGPLRLHGTWRQNLNVSTRPMKDMPILHARGPGRFVGCTLAIRNPTRTWWGEGDEKFYVDGEAFPSTFGTGTEDYFGYAWGSSELFNGPFHSQARCDGPRNYGWSSLNRFHLADSIPFQESLRFDMELWHWEEQEVDFVTTAWWYAPADAPAGGPPLPELDDRIPAQVPEWQVFRVEGALEGESLSLLEKSGGETQVQEMGGFGGDWSGEAQLWWTGAQPGDHLDLRLPVASTGRYRLQAAFTKARDYGQVQLELDGQALGQSLDLYDPKVVSTGLLNLGEVQLQAGDRRLRLRITGANEAAVKAYMVGLDYLKLEPVEAGAETGEGAQAQGFHSFQVNALEGEPVDLAQYQGKVCLVVNVASQCGYTPQYAGLQSLHQSMSEMGFAVLGFPCNQFGGQEPGSAAEIRQFCESRYQVGFPMFEKLKVKKGEEQAALYGFLSASHPAPNWNFCKYLIGKDGRVRGFYPSQVKPDDDRLLQDILLALSEE
ncbi:MAG: DUF2961 domain-containing protein [Planctomycetota bacterium]|nr:MAG: DUF2961 domain-containing protein [Planctomycetota bacterium]